MVSVTDRVAGQPSSKPAQRARDPSPDHSPASSGGGTTLPVTGVVVGSSWVSRRPSTSWAATATAISPTRTTRTPTVHHGGRPDDRGGVAGPPPDGSITGAPPSRCLPDGTEHGRSGPARCPRGCPGSNTGSGRSGGAEARV